MKQLYLIHDTFDLNYYDYTNQNYTLRYSGTKNRIENYSVRKGELDTYPEHNCTVAFEKMKIHLIKYES